MTQNRSGGGGGGSALSDEEREQIVAAARKEKAVGEQETRLYETAYDLKAGKPEDAARGLDDRMRVDLAQFHTRIGKGIDGIEEEAREFPGSPEVHETVNYVLNQRTSEKVFPNGIRDQGRNSARPEHFTSHPIAQDSKLSGSEVLSTRIYTTSVYRELNNPLRDDARYARRTSVPLSVISFHADKAIRKMRALWANRPTQEQVKVWRGMRNVRVSDEFMRKGGTELAFMSTTMDLCVAVRYSLSRHSLLFKIVAPNFMSLGAELKWLSAFPSEAEVLFPPLTFLQPTGRTEIVDAVDCDGNPVTFTVIEVTPYI